MRGAATDAPGELEVHLADCDREVARDAQADARAQRVARLSGVGVLTASEPDGSRTLA